MLYGLVGKRFREFVCDSVRVDGVCIFVVLVGKRFSYCCWLMVYVYLFVLIGVVC